MRPLDKARLAAEERRVARKAAGLKSTMTPLERLRAHPTSPSKAIAAKCWQCQGEDGDPGVRWRIGNCEVGEDCALYGLRPYRNLQGTPKPAGLRVVTE